jgi:hypothetical protein
MYHKYTLKYQKFHKKKCKKIKEIPFREDFPCHSTWKRCKHSGHFSIFRNIIGNFCIIKQKCLCNYIINITSKNATIIYVPFCAFPTCYYLSFVFPATLIWLLHCNAMHFDSFSLGARHLFQKLV